MTAINGVIPISNLTLEGITKVDGEENMGGMTIQLYYGLKSHIATYPVLVTDPQDVDDLVRLVGSYIMHEGKFFFPIEAIMRTVQFTFENQGELEGQSFLQKGMFKTKSATSGKSMGYARLFNNTCGVLIMIDNFGNRIVIGDEIHPAYIKPSGDSGTDPTNRSETSYEVTSDSFCPAYLYYGAIPLVGGDEVPAVES